MADDDARTDNERRLAALLIERFGPRARRRDHTTDPAEALPRPPEREQEEDP